MFASLLSAFTAPLPDAVQASSVGTLLNALLMVALAHAVWTDVRTRRISNRLTYPLMLAGLAINGATAGREGLTGAAMGLLLGGAVLLIPCALGAMGLGDAKLMAAIGALKGPFFAFHTLVYAALAGGLLALVYLVLLKEGYVVSRLGRWLGGVPAAGSDGVPAAGSDGVAAASGVASLRKASMPYAPAIAAGALYALFSYALR